MYVFKKSLIQEPSKILDPKLENTEILIYLLFEKRTLRTSKGHKICPTKEIGYIVYIFAFYATKVGSRDSGETKVDSHWV